MFIVEPNCLQVGDRSRFIRAILLNNPRLIADRMKLYRMITNLVGNAVKFTDRGRVRLNLTTNPGALLSRNASLIGLAVEDTGAGIPVDEHAMLFESFVTGKHKRSGSGLGLIFNAADYGSA